MITGIVVLSLFSDVLSILTVVVIVCLIVIVSVSFVRIGLTSFPFKTMNKLRCQPIRIPAPLGSRRHGDSIA